MCPRPGSDSPWPGVERQRRIRSSRNRVRSRRSWRRGTAWRKYRPPHRTRPRCRSGVPNARCDAARAREVSPHEERGQVGTCSVLVEDAQSLGIRKAGSTGSVEARTQRYPTRAVPARDPVGGNAARLQELPRRVERRRARPRAVVVEDRERGARLPARSSEPGRKYAPGAAVESPDPVQQLTTGLAEEASHVERRGIRSGPVVVPHERGARAASLEVHAREAIGPFGRTGLRVGGARDQSSQEYCGKDARRSTVHVHTCS